MKKNSKASVALHALAHLIKQQAPVTSEALGICLQTNPVVVRRVLGELKKKGIVESEKGHGGGWIVAKDAKDISFSDVFHALDEKLVPAAPKLDNDEQCMIMKTLALIMSDFLSDAQALLDNRLKKISIHDLVTQLELPHHQSHTPCP